MRFYDLSGANAAHPKLVSTYTPPTQPHEIYLWMDPHNRNRALLFMTTFENDLAPLGAPNLIVTDISGARQGHFREIVKTNLVRLYPKALLKRTEVDVHSISLTPDGRHAYVSVWGGTFLVVDTSQFASGASHPFQAADADREPADVAKRAHPLGGADTRHPLRANDG